MDDPIEGRAACHVVEAEWRVAGWLERQGIQHDIYAESQLDDGTLVLDEYKVLLITTHPEYLPFSLTNGEIKYPNLSLGSAIRY